MAEVNSIFQQTIGTKCYVFVCKCLSHIYVINRGIEYLL